MKPAPFEYIRAHTIEEAVAALKNHADAKILAGGQSLVPVMNFRLSRPPWLVDINPVEALKHISFAESSVTIGALARHQVLLENEELAHKIPVLHQAVQHIGHWAIRQRGTLGGSVAHADPAAELPAVLVALGATIRVQTPEGPIHIPAHEFFVGFYTTVLSADSLVIEVEIPYPPHPVGFYEIARRRGDFALAGAFVEVAGPSHGAVTWFGVTPSPMRKAWTTALASDSKERLLDWERLLEDVSLIDDSRERRVMAVSVAERAYQSVGGGR